jgi:hypothetical protein
MKFMTHLVLIKICISHKKRPGDQASEHDDDVVTFGNDLANIYVCQGCQLIPPSKKSCSERVISFWSKQPQRPLNELSAVLYPHFSLCFLSKNPFLSKLF